MEWPQLLAPVSRSIMRGIAGGMTSGVTYFGMLAGWSVPTAIAAATARRAGRASTG